MFGYVVHVIYKALSGELTNVQTDLVFSHLYIYKIGSQLI